MSSKIIFVLCLFYSLFANSWTSETKTKVLKLSEKLTMTQPFSDGFEFSLWSSIRSRMYRVQPHISRVGSRYLQSEVRVAYEIKNRKDAHLNVYIPGIFNNIDEGQARRAFSRMSKLGKNFVVLPNPWGTDYIKAGPSHKPGDIVQEADSLYELVLNFVTEQDLPADTKITLYGASYGGFLAAVMASIDAMTETSMISPKVYTFSPPIDMKQAIGNLDQLMFEDDFLNRKISGMDQASVFLDYVNAENSDDLDIKSRILAKDFVSRFGFKEAFREAIRLYYKQNPDPNYEARRIYYFSNYLSDLAPELKSLLYSDVAKIEYWTVQAKKNFGIHIYVLSTKNDFLNDNYINYSKYDPEHFFFFENGGHLGFIEMPGFVEVLKSTR